MDDASGTSIDPDRPQWQGSPARRGVARSGAGWREPEREDAPRWLGSVARRGGGRQETPTPERRDPQAWLGSTARRRLTSAPLPPADGTTAVEATVVQFADRRDPAPPTGPESATGSRTVAGELGMSLRVA